MIHTILYISNAEQYFSDDELSSLLDLARERNKERNITGALLFVNQLFVQILEGEQKEIDRLVRKIEKDERHSGLRILINQKIDDRLFDDWSMAFHKTNPEELAELGYFTVEEFKNITEGEVGDETLHVMQSIIKANTNNVPR